MAAEIGLSALGLLIGGLMSLVYLRWLAFDIGRLQQAARPGQRLLIGFLARMLAVLGSLYALLALLGVAAALAALAGFMLGRWIFVRRMCPEVSL